MPDRHELSERELRVLEAVVQSYVETAEPAASRAIATRSGLGVSPATVRSIMSELEEKGFLFHPHTSAGRVPTDRAYRAYVDRMVRRAPPSHDDRRALETELQGGGSVVEELLRRAAQVLGVLTQELGVAVAPALDRVVLERVELLPVASDRLLLVLNLRSGVVRTIFVRLPAMLPTAAIQGVARILNERLGGLTLEEVRTSFTDRLRDAAGPGERDLLDIFIAEGEDIFSLARDDAPVVLGSAQMLAEQPEFASNERMRGLLALTERRDLLREALAARRSAGLQITIGGEHDDTRLAGLTLVTASYRKGELAGVIGVIGPTRMPYDKIIGLVEHTGRMVEGLME